MGGMRTAPRSHFHLCDICATCTCRIVFPLGEIKTTLCKLHKNELVDFSCALWYNESNSYCGFSKMNGGE